MGMSASQARLLSITARLTSNEYESQQITNAKMRLAIKSQEASEEYIKALDTIKMQFTSYDAQGDAVNTSLTANAIYQYSDLKNQYALVNPSGQIMISQEDATNFRNANSLSEFLEANGVTKVYKTKELEECIKRLEDPVVKGYYEAWENAVNYFKTNEKTPANYQNDKYITSIVYQSATSEYMALKDSYQKDPYSGVEFEDVKNAEKEWQNSKVLYSACIDFNTYCENLAKYFAVGDEAMDTNRPLWIQNGNEWQDISSTHAAPEETNTEKNLITSNEVANVLNYTINAPKDDNDNLIFTSAYKNVVENYYPVVQAYQLIAEDLGINTVEDTYHYSDEAKAQWYTNLWYRLNGESSDKSTQGKNETNFTTLDRKLLDSASWIQDAMTQGIVTLEVASYNKQTNYIPDQNAPTSVILKGISWASTNYASCSDFSQADDDKAIARAEAEYERKNTEITNKDTRYQYQIKMLDSEHNVLQTEYDSIKNAISKNIDRSFKAFS